MSTVVQQERRPYPKTGEVFELTVSMDITGLGLVANFGYDPKNWRSNVKTVLSGVSRRFKLVHLGYCRTLEDVQHRLAEYGKVPSGIWCQVLDEAFVQDGVGPVGVADPSWVSSNNNICFPMIYFHGRRDFSGFGRGWSDDWRWLVEVE